MRTFTKFGALTLLAVIGSAATARADMVSVAGIGTINMSPNSQSGYVNLNIFDANPSVAANLYGWSLGLRVVPLSGATGTVTIDTASMVYAPDPLLTSPNPVGVPTPSATPSPGDVTVFAADNSFNSVVVPGTQKGMVSLKFNASSNAAGDFALQLVDAGGLSNTYWADFDQGGDSTALYFSGSPIVGTGGVQIGTLSLPAAIPEPSGILLSGAVASAAAWRSRRRKTPQQTADL